MVVVVAVMAVCLAEPARKKHGHRRKHKHGKRSVEANPIDVHQPDHFHGQRLAEASPFDDLDLDHHHIKRSADPNPPRKPHKPAPHKPSPKASGRATISGGLIFGKGKHH
ncbi:hypothetical protein Pcinc_033362 [Petrolisthes cinctipes]|uniref:Uncharacterized protein n=1 Tax=Petrolisthes cinctipes TaxID=88211 RepID=A0AAE1ESK0_PETCI|nr:hypothetical protein Pcinc_033362 [Petrolisthes cinctipes]